MSDAIREAFEALERVGNYVSVPYEMMVQFADDLDTVKAALSANGGEAITPVWDNKVLVSNIVRAFWRRIYTYKDRYPAKELPREVPVELYCAMSTALMHLDNESLNPKHPAPPSVAVPEGFDVRRNSEGDIIVTRLSDGGAAAYSKDSPMVTVVMGWHFLDAMLTAAPQPDHSPDAGKVVPLGYLTNQAVARLQSDERLNGEHLYAFKPDDMNKFQAVYLDPAVKDSLTVAHPAESREEIQAQALDGFADDIDRRVDEWKAAKENALYRSIIEGQEWSEKARLRAARLRASQQEGNTAGDDGEGV